MRRNDEGAVELTTLETDVLARYGSALRCSGWPTWEDDLPEFSERSFAAVEEAVDRPDTPTSEPAPTITSKARSDSWVTEPASATHTHTRRLLMDRRQTGAPVVDVTEEPCPTITGAMFGKGVAKVWWEERPATTIVGSFRPDIVAAPGYRTEVSRQDAEGSVQITPTEAAILQSFDPAYPWQGSRSKQFEQVGNAVPPLLAAHVLSVLVGRELVDAEDAA